MIDSVAVKNFQSLYDVEIPLSPFTVLTGASSTGKSAFIRAMRLLFQNQRGSSFISHGQQTARVAATFENGHAVMVERGKDNAYTLVSPHSEAQRYTKLGGEVPEDVKKFIGIDPAISIASQFDPPFMLTASGAEVARTLGSLTNVDVVMNAAREANRRKLQASTYARAAQDSLSGLQEQLSALGDLSARQEAVEAAEHAYSEVAAAEHKHGQVVELIDAIRDAAKALREITVTEIPDLEELFEDARSASRAAEDADSLVQQIRGIQIPEVSDVPEVDEEIAAARAAWKRYDEFAWLRMEIGLKVESFSEAKKQAAQLQQELEEAEALRLEALAAAGVCPMCGQDTGHLGH